MTMLSDLTAPAKGRQTRTALFLMVAMAAVVGSALGFEHIGGYIPCALCLEQRTPYYLGIPVMIAALLNQGFNGPAFITRGLILLGALLMSYDFVLAVYHSGVEWHFWPGPDSCSTAAQGVTTNAGDLLADLNAKHPPSCDAAALRILGLSMAGWNAIASAILAWVGYRGAFARG